jgi:hypothetical protein
MSKTRFVYLAFPVFIVIILAFCSCGKTASSIPGTIDSNTVDNRSSDLPSSGFPEWLANQDDFSNWKISETDAITIASRYVPAEVVSHAKIFANQGVSGNIYTGEKHFYWVVVFMDISVTKAWLGWQSDNQTIMDVMEPYGQLTVNIDGLTGEFIDRRANYPIRLGPPPGISFTPVIPWTPTQ